jgi:translation initiation factor IF-3
VISEDGEQLGVMDVRDAIQRARAAGVDLVEVAPNAQPPVCRMIDYGKFLYEEKKRAAEAKKKQVTVSVKEIKFRPGTDEHDYSYRMKHAREWLEGGDKVRAAIAFRGREMTHRELGAKILKKLTEDLADLAEVEISPKMEGYQMFTIFVPKKAKVSKAKAAASVEKAAKKETADEPAVEKAAKETTGEPASVGEPAPAVAEAADQAEG